MTEELLHELEDEYGVELDPNFDAGVNGLCNHTTCPHSECECWTNEERAVREQLRKQAEEIKFTDGTPIILDADGMIKLPEDSNDKV